MIDKAINKFATDVTDDNVVNSYKELIDWVAKHGPEATKMAGGISENKTAIADLKTLVGTLPEGATSTTVVAYITEAINALSIGDYAKTTEVTAAISTALESYYTKTQVDETFVKKTDIVMATDAEVDAMLTKSSALRLPSDPAYASGGWGFLSPVPPFERKVTTHGRA